MVVYGEYLFLENFIAGGMILYFTAKAAGQSVGVVRMTLCSILCGLYAFTMFLAVPPAAGFCGKILFVLLLSRLAFGKKSLRTLALYGALFFAVTMFYGGVTIAMLSIFQWQGAFDAGGVYLPAVTYLTVTFAAAAGALFVLLILQIIKEKRQAARTEVSVRVQMGEVNMALSGFIDSGNFLREPVTGKPVAVVRRDVFEQMLRVLEVPPSRYTAVPYHTVGTEKGILDGYRLDRLVAEFPRGPAQIVKKPVLAVSAGSEFLAGGNEKGQILLPESMLERGIYADLKDNQRIFSKTSWNHERRMFLHRGKRCAAAAAFQRRGTEDAGGVCQRESGRQSSAD